jgi:hypothetical protein
MGGFANSQSSAVTDKHGSDEAHLWMETRRTPEEVFGLFGALSLSAAYGRNQRRRRPGARRIDFKETVAPTFEEVNHRTQAGLKWRFSLICSGMP